MEQHNPLDKDEEKLPPPFKRDGGHGKKSPAFPVSIGQDDKEPGIGPQSPDGGMIVGPEHPIFDAPHTRPTRPLGPAFLPP
jgi:hypothetical protein